MFLNYGHLRYFWAVAREGNLTKAARRLNLSQSALSAQISTLEAQLGHLLFERRGRGLVLTEAGQIAFDHADAIFTTGDDLLARLKGAGAAARSVLRVGALATLSRNFQLGFLMPALLDPELSLSIRSGGLAELLALLEGHQLDVLLVNQAPVRAANSAWVVHVLAEQMVSLIGPPALIGDRTDAAALMSAHPLIVPSQESGIRSGFDALIERLGIAPTIIAEADDMAMLRVLARQGIGLAVLPPIVVQDELNSGALCEACALPSLRETFSAITLKRRFSHPALTRLLAKQDASD
jgi:LysR family transcriptional regulator, transcriptional activator of nhaA